MISCLRARVIDIGLSLIEIENTDRPQATVTDLRECHQPVAIDGPNGGALAEILTKRLVGARHGSSVSEGCRLCLGYGKRRDVVQRGLNRKQMLGSGGTMPHNCEVFQGNRPLGAKPPDPEAPQGDDVGECAEGPAQIPG